MIRISPSGIQRTAKPISCNTKNAKLDVLPLSPFQQSLCGVGKCPKEAKCPSGAIFIEDASFFIERGDGNNDLGIGVRYHIRHSLITVIPPHVPHVNASDPHHVTEFTTDEDAPIINEHSSTKQAVMVTLLVIVGIMCAMFVLCGYTVYKYPLDLKHLSRWRCRYGLFERWMKQSGEGQRLSIWTSHGEKVGYGRQPTFLTPELPSDPLAAYMLAFDPTESARSAY